MFGYKFARASAFTAQELANSTALKRDLAVGAANIIGASTAGVFLTSAGSSFIKFVATCATAAATISTTKQLTNYYDAQIKSINKVGSINNLENRYIASAECEDYINTAIVDNNGYEKNGYFIKGTSPTKISNPFTLHALLKIQMNDQNQQVYIPNGQYKMVSSYEQLMQKMEHGVYTNKTVEDTPIAPLTSETIFAQLSQKYTSEKLYQALALEQKDISEQCYVVGKMENQKATISSWIFGVDKKAQQENYKKEYNDLMNIAKEHNSLLSLPEESNLSLNVSKEQKSLSEEASDSETINDNCSDVTDSYDDISPFEAVEEDTYAVVSGSSSFYDDIEY